jgi:hypothetical protein
VITLLIRPEALASIYRCPEPSQQRECPRHRDDVGDVGALELQETSDPLGE